MNYQFKIELYLKAVTAALCFLLLFKLYQLLSSNFVWRVNCWFCNNNFWVRYVERNSWTCPKCEQYNGFTKDGDYNKTLICGNEQSQKSLKVFKKSPPRNGLCKMCNINQELKVAQLANFVPTIERKYDEEIETYRMQLEKAYKLCSPCKKVLQIKLHKEKEKLLGTKLLGLRTPEKKKEQNYEYNPNIQNFINNMSMFIGGLILILVSVECYHNIKNDKSLSTSVRNILEIITGLMERLFSILKMKISTTFPVVVNLYDFNIFNIDFTSKLDILASEPIKQYIVLSQELLGGLACMLLIIGHVLNANKIKYAIIIDFLWTVFMVVTMARHSLQINPATISLIKFLSVTTSILVCKSIKRKVNCKRQESTVKSTVSSNIKNLTAKKLNLMSDNEENSVDSDDDVSLSKYGLHNITDSSTDTVNAHKNTFASGRTFTPRSDSLWSQPKLNSTFCVNSLLNQTKTPSSVSETVFLKPSFEKYQKLMKDDSDSDLDESISSLTIGTPKKSKHKNKSIFSLRKFTATPSFIAPTPLNRSRPLISPSKLGHSTSWVAGGYWGSEGERQIFTLNGSRSSSQSSGFESQTSSVNQRNVFSHPPSREESVCRDVDRATMLVNPFQTCNINNNAGYLSPQNFSRVSSPIYPQMQYNGHVHIPQPRFAHQTISPAHSLFTKQQTFTNNSMFKSPGGGNISFSQMNSFNR